MRNEDLSADSLQIMKRLFLIADFSLTTEI